MALTCAECEASAFRNNIVVAFHMRRPAGVPQWKNFRYFGASEPCSRYRHCIFVWNFALLTNIDDRMRKYCQYYVIAFRFNFRSWFSFTFLHMHKHILANGHIVHRANKCPPRSDNNVPSFSSQPPMSTENSHSNILYSISSYRPDGDAAHNGLKITSYINGPRFSVFHKLIRALCMADGGICKVTNNKMHDESTYMFAMHGDWGMG